MKKRNSLKLAVGTCFALSAFSLFAADTIKIGLAGPHTGDLVAYGMPSKEAAEMVVAEVNAKGGINGKQIELIAVDDQCKPELATNAATKLASQGVAMVIGHVCSGATKASLAIYKNAKIISISPSATAPALTQAKEYPNFYRTIMSDDAQAVVAADFALNKLNAKKIALIHDKGDYGKGFVDFVKAGIEKNGTAKVVVYEGIAPGAVDYSAVIQKVKAEGADTLIFGGYHPEASKLVLLLDKRKMKLNFIGPDGVKGEGFLKIAGENAEGVYGTAPTDVSTLPLNIKARADYKAKYGKEAGNFFDQAYAATLAAVNALRVAGNTDYDALGKALKTSPVDTPIGKIKFDDKGDAEGVRSAIYQVQKGKFVEVK